MTELSEQEEKVLEERDDRVAKVLLETMNSLAASISERYREAREFEAARRRVREAVEKGEWWALKGILSPADVESLCNVSPGLDLDTLVWS